MQVLLSVCELVQTCKIGEKFTAQKDRATGEKEAATELKLGTYAISQNFSHKLLVPVEILHPQLPLSTSHGCAAIQRLLEPAP